MRKQAMMTIKEFSEFTAVPQSMLRYYDKIGLFSPIIRGENNYRYYAYQQIITLNQVIKLTELKVPLKEIEYMSEKRTPQSTIKLLEHQEVVLGDELRKIAEELTIIRTLERLLNYSLGIDENVITPYKLDESILAFAPENDFGDNASFYTAFKKACNWFRTQKVNLSYPIGGYFDTFEGFTKEPSRPSKFFSIDPNGPDKRNAGNYLRAYTRGFYGEMGDLPERFTDYISANKIKKPGAVYVLYVQDEVSIPEPSNYLAQASLELH
ncbi:MAG: MerR family DNA-binding transcriptional regulator [Oscillospiraceae bacterium]|jgi:DNA-binding transcriptional MerR regulator|nr:MerR family DNA-binding transcriptional regulator [Oscillospiraceae bacterium]